jgi:hypothetical protein
VDAVRQMQRLWPDIRVLFTSALFLNDVSEAGFADPVELVDEHTAFLPKPFTFRVFRDTVRGLLAEDIFHVVQHAPVMRH